MASPICKCLHRYVQGNKQFVELTLCIQQAER